MRPRTDEVLQSIIWSYDEHILPAVQGDFPKSLALTVSNLLRHVLLRLEREGPALVEDNSELRGVLGTIAAYVASLDQAPASFAALQASLEQAVVEPAVGGYRSLTDLSDEAHHLRSLLDQALKALQEHRNSLGTAPAYQAIRGKIRSYLGSQLTRQSQWIQEAFTIERR